MNAGWRNTFHSHFAAYLGNLEGVLETRDDPYPGGLVCVRNSGGTSEEFTAYIHPSSGLVVDYRTPAGLSVRVGRWGDDPRWWIMGATTSEGMTATSGRSLIQEYAQGVQYPVGANLMDFRVMPSAGLVVRVEQGVYYGVDGAWKYWAGGTYDLTTLKNALSAGQHQMVVVGLDVDAGALTAIGATAEAGSDKLAWSGRLAEISIPARVIPGGAVWLYYGMTTIEESHIYRGADEARAFMQTAGVRVRYSAANVTTPYPSLVELTSAFGSPSAVGAGFVAVINDNGGGANGWIVWSDGSNYWCIAGTKAV